MPLLLMFAVRDAQGQARTYAAEWANPNRLTRQGITRDTLKPGDAVVVTGSPGRTATEYKLHLKGIHRPADGWAWEPPVSAKPIQSQPLAQRADLDTDDTTCPRCGESHELAKVKGCVKCLKCGYKFDCNGW